LFRLNDYNYVIQRKLPSPGFQVEVVLVDYDGSEPPKQQVADQAADNKSDADSSTSTSAKENYAVHVESNKEAGGDDKDDVFSDNEAEDGSSKGKKEKVSSSGQGTSNAAKGSETCVAQKEASAASSCIEKVTISIEQGNARAPDAGTLKTEASSKNNSTTTQPTAVESSSMSEFKAIAADASVFSFGDEDEYESE
jgi:phosphatidylinositol-3,4,5-trisphosphate 3-phosphatase/dual-specificity protein phosphatase PTEN